MTSKGQRGDFGREVIFFSLVSKGYIMCYFVQLFPFVYLYAVSYVSITPQYIFLKSVLKHKIWAVTRDIF